MKILGIELFKDRKRAKPVFKEEKPVKRDMPQNMHKTASGRTKRKPPESH